MKQAEPLTEEHKQKIWQVKVLTDHILQVLFNTIIYMSRALLSGGNIINCGTNPLQIKLVETLAVNTQKTSESIISTHKAMLPQYVIDGMIHNVTCSAVAEMMTW